MSVGKDEHRHGQEVHVVGHATGPVSAGMRIAKDAYTDGQQKEVKGYQNGTFHDEITQILPVIFAQRCPCQNVS